MALRGLAELDRERDPFPPPAYDNTADDEEQSTSRAVYESVRADSSPVAEFVRRCLVRQEGGFVPYPALHDAYTRWCAENTNSRAYSHHAFVRMLIFGLGLPRGRRRMGDDRQRGVEGYMWTELGRQVAAGNSTF